MARVKKLVERTARCCFIAPSKNVDEIVFIRASGKKTFHKVKLTWGALKHTVRVTKRNTVLGRSSSQFTVCFSSCQPPPPET